jgi:GNAT superfamily N-acetyltransferase
VADAPPEVEVRDLLPDEVDAAAATLGRAMRDNPINVAVYGGDPARREARLRRLFRTLFRTTSAQTPLVAVEGDTLVGVAGIAPPGTCQPTLTAQLRFAPGTLALGPAAARRFLRWLGAWAQRDLDERHSHFGPFGVEPTRQAHGIGTRVLHEYCRRIDAEATTGYLETDKDVNVRLYERHGFEVVDEGPVLGVHCWYLRRPSRRDGRAFPRAARPGRGSWR